MQVEREGEDARDCSHRKSCLLEQHVHGQLTQVKALPLALALHLLLPLLDHVLVKLLSFLDSSLFRSQHGESALH